MKKLKNGSTARFTVSDGSTVEATVHRPWWWWLVPAMWTMFYLTGAIFFDPRNGEPIPAAGLIMVYKRNVVFIQMEE